jgi:serine/threonine protein kinase/tetratricopeptide (TPR) repeat protein/TolB-like protein
MAMTPDKWEKVKVLFESALQRPTEQRIAYLTAACAEEDVRAQVIRLLANFHDAGSFRNDPAQSGFKLAPSSADDGSPSPPGPPVRRSGKLVGQVLSHYRVLEQIGEGGMGVVYRARDERLDRDVALKVLSPTLLHDETFLYRFQREARLLSKLNHPNIATVHDFDTVNATSFLVMEFIKGQTLNTKLSAGPLPEAEVLRLAAQLLDGLQAAHQEGIVHRDLKPGNLRETPDGRLKILDFGLARIPLTNLDSTQSTAGVVGTLPYMAPEQLQGEAVDARTDIYSTGVVLYELATGQRPFAENFGPRLMDAILHRSITAPRELNPQVSAGLDAVIRKALEKDPWRRYHSAREMRTELQRLSGAESSAPPDSPSLEHAQAPPMEIAHVLCTDIVGYSSFPMDEQQKLLRRLQSIVRETQEFSRARSQDRLIPLPTGDGMTLVFFGEPESAARCALELGRKLRQVPELPLRMGLNSGPVYRVADINANRNVAGGGIRISQRVMDCGDAGHILLSQSVADVLCQLSAWKGQLHDLGQVEAGQGELVHVFNLVTEDAGNPVPPTKLTARREQKDDTVRLQKKWAGMGLAALTVIGLAVAGWIFRGSIFGQRNFRPTIAVLGFKNQSGTPESDWVSDSLSEMLASELAAGDHVVPTPGESVSRMKLDLGLPDEASYAPETVERVQRRLHCDYVVYGAFFDPGKAAGGRVQLDLRLERAPTHEVLASVSESGTELTLPELAARAGATLRSRLGVPGISTSNSSELQAALPSTPDAQRQYFEGLRQLRSFDLLGARDSLTSATTADPNFSLAHAYLADAWQGLGYDDNAKQEARTGFELSTRLGREDKALVEARFREISSEWDKAIDLYRSLWTLYPENPEYAFRTSYVQIRAGKAAEAMGTIAELRKQMGPKNTDPRLDLKEAEAAEALSDFPKEKQAATRAADGARTNGYRLLEAEALWRGCNAMASLGEASHAQAACQRSIELAKPVNDLVLVARGFTILGLVASSQGDPKQALELHRQALEFTRKIGSRRDVVGALINIGNCLADQGNFPAAQKNYEDGIAVALEIDDKGQAITLLNNLATLSQSEGKFPAALKLYHQALDQARAIQDKGSTALTQGNIGVILSLQGNFPSALENISQAIKQSEETGNKSDRALFLIALGDTYLAQGALASAEQNCRAGLNLAMEISEKSTMAEAQICLANLKVQQGKAAEAEVLAKQAADEFHAESMRDMEAEARIVLASALLDLERTQDAAKQLDIISGLSSQDSVNKLSLAIIAARLEARAGKASEARKALGSVVSQAKSIGIPGLEFEAQLAQGEIGLYGGDKRAALSLLSNLRKDAANKGLKQYESRASEMARQISTDNRPKSLHE